MSHSPPRVFTLTDVTRRLREVLDPVSQKRFWVRAEVVKPSEKDGHLYATVVELHDGRKVAEMRITIWKSTLSSIRRRFRDTGIDFALQDGHQALLECQVAFHPVHGLTLNVLDADPSFLLGEMERLKRELIARLISEGLDRVNPQLPVPALPLRIGLITSRDSAACSDVITTLRNAGFGFRVHLADALMQGEHTTDSVLRAMQALERIRPELILLARGGGSRTDLAWLDSEPIARAIAASPLPVWTAIGHDIDHGVPDIVAHSSFKTPTAAAEAIVARFAAAEKHITHATDVLRREWERGHQRHRKVVDDDTVGIRQGTRKLAEQTRSHLVNQAERLQIGIDQRMLKERMLSGQLLTAIRRATEARCTRDRMHAVNSGQRLSDLVRGRHTLTVAALHAQRQRLEREPWRLRFASLRASLEDRERIILAHDPRNALRRGYAIIKKDNTIQTSMTAFHEGDAITIHMHDGMAETTIQRIEGHHE